MIFCWSGCEIYNSCKKREKKTYDTRSSTSFLWPDWVSSTWYGRKQLTTLSIPNRSPMWVLTEPDAYLNFLPLTGLGDRLRGMAVSISSASSTATQPRRSLPMTHTVYKSAVSVIRSRAHLQSQTLCNHSLFSSKSLISRVSSRTYRYVEFSRTKFPFPIPQKKKLLNNKTNINKINSLSLLTRNIYWWENSKCAICIKTPWMKKKLAAM